MYFFHLLHLFFYYDVVYVVTDNLDTFQDFLIA
jgi:hypothetical protein